MFIGDLKNVNRLEVLANKLINQKESLTYKLGTEKHKIKTVLLEAAKDKKTKKNNYTALWYDPEFVKNFKGSRIYLDGTHKVQPKRALGLKRASQLLTIMAEKEGKVMRKIDINFY